MRIPTAAEMIGQLEHLAESGELTDTESATLSPIAKVMHSGIVTKLTNRQIKALAAMHSDHFGSTTNA